MKVILQADVKGSGKILERVETELGIKLDQTSADGLFSIEACRCVGACGLAPVMTVNGEVYGRLTPDMVPAIIKKYKDLEANRDDRVYEFCHYIYVDNDGIYPKNIKVNVCIDTKEVFTWL